MFITKRLYQSKALINAYTEEKSWHWAGMTSMLTWMLTRALTGHCDQNKHIFNLILMRTASADFAMLPLHLLMQCCLLST